MKVVFDGHDVDERIVLLTKQLHCILLLIMFLDELLASRVRWFFACRRRQCP